MGGRKEGLASAWVWMVGTGGYANRSVGGGGWEYMERQVDCWMKDQMDPLMALSLAKL